MEKNRLFFLMGASILVVAIVVVFGNQLWRQQQIKKAQEENRIFTYSSKFVLDKTAKVEQTDDELKTARLLRGPLKEIDTDGNLVVAAYTNWPDTSKVRPINLTLTEKTQYLCWPSHFPDSNPPIQVTSSIFFLDDNTRLEMKGQTYLTREQFDQIVKKSPESIIGLQQKYVSVGKNIAYQVAVVGCQDEK